MDPKSEAQLLRIFIGESDKIHHLPLFEVIVREAKNSGLAGATAWRGLTGRLRQAAGPRHSTPPEAARR